MNERNVEQAKELYQLVDHLIRFMHRGRDFSAWAGGAGSQLTLHQMKALMALGAIAPCSLKQLAAELDVSPASASGMVERLVEMGLVDRRQNPGDRRLVHMTLTPRALRLVQRKEEFFLARILWLMQELGPEDTRRWIEVYRRIDAVLLAASTPKGASS